MSECVHCHRQAKMVRNNVAICCLDCPLDGTHTERCDRNQSSEEMSSEG